MGGLIAAACAVVILLRALFGRFAVALAFGWAASRCSCCRPSRRWRGAPGRRSPFRSATSRWSPGSVASRSFASPSIRDGVLAVAGVALAPRGRRWRRRARRRGAGLVVLAPPAPARSGAPARRPPEVSLRPLLGPVARAGVRFRSRSRAKGGGRGRDRVQLRIGPRPGRRPAVPALVTLAPGEIGGRGHRSARERFRVPLPVRWVDAAKPIVGTIGSLAARRLRHDRPLGRGGRGDRSRRRCRRSRARSRSSTRS